MARRTQQRSHVPTLRIPPPMHQPLVCTRATVRDLFYRWFVHSRVPFIRSPARALVRKMLARADARAKQTPLYDIERRTAARYCKGHGIDIGCGSKKTVPEAIGVDVTPKGAYGFAGSQLFEACQADVLASGDDLWMFKDGALDYVVARHNLEHYQDPVKTLQEWQRVLRIGGTLILVMPDDEDRHTITLDPSHYHVYTRESLARLLGVIGGFRITRNDRLIPSWSFILVAKKQ